MEPLKISEAKSRFSEYVSRAAAGERFLIERRERPLAALISVAELERLERTAGMARRLALALGQEAELLESIEKGKTHPAMAAFGLWRDAGDLATLDEQITENRHKGGSRPGVEL